MMGLSKKKKNPEESIGKDNWLLFSLGKTRFISSYLSFSNILEPGVPEWLSGGGGHLTLDYHSGHDLGVEGWAPSLAESPLGFSLLLFLPYPLTKLILSLSL